MKAVVLKGYGGPEVLDFDEVDDPTIGPEEILISVRAAGTNRADLLQREGLYPPPDPKPQHEILGLECAGTVEALGERVTLFRKGQAVAALVSGGAYAEKVSVHERMAFAVPENLSWAEAAAIPEAFLTAYDALRDKAAVGAGSRVLIHAAAGGVGSVAVQLAHWMGALVIATVGTEEKAKWVQSLGADQSVVYRSQPFLEAAEAKGGVHAVLDFVGQAYWDDNISALVPGGVLVIIGTLSGSMASVNLGRLLQKRLTVRGTALRTRPLEARMALMQEFSQRVLPAIGQGVLRPLLDQTLAFDEVAEAHRHLAAEQARGKTILLW